MTVRVLSIKECIKRNLLDRNGFRNVLRDPGYGKPMNKFFGNIHEVDRATVDEYSVQISGWWFPIEIIEIINPIKTLKLI